MKISITHNKIMYFLLLIMPFVDIVTGIALNQGEIGLLASVGKIYRFVLILYLIYTMVFVKKSRRNIWLIGFTVFVLLTMVFNAIRLGGSISEDFSYVLKMLLPIYLVCSLVIVDKNNVIVSRVNKAFLWIYPLSFVVPKILGLGYYSYGNESGYKAFYFANNEVNVIFMVLYVYAFDSFYNNFTKNRKKFVFANVIQLITIILSLLLIGSKTSILAIAIVVLAYLFKKEKLAIKLKYIWLVSISVVLIVPIVIFSMRDQLLRMFARIVWYFYRYTVGNDNFFEGVLTFLCSERNLRIKPSVDYWYYNSENASILNVLFGIGKSSKAPDNTNIYVNPFSLIELDFFECWFWFGGIITIIIMFFYLKPFIQSVKTKGLMKEKIVYILVFSFSMIAGHVLVSANSGTMFAIVIVDLMYKTKRKKELMQYFNLTKKFS